MPNRIAISAAKKFAKEQGLTQIVILGYDKDKVHVVTYGVTKQDCAAAAKSGKWAMEALVSEVRIDPLPDHERFGYQP